LSVEFAKRAQATGRGATGRGATRRGATGRQRTPVEMAWGTVDHGTVTSLSDSTSAAVDARLAELESLAALVRSGGVVVLSGAGISTESGIPDYRGPSGASLRKHAPMTYQAFTREL